MTEVFTSLTLFASEAHNSGFLFHKRMVYFSREKWSSWYTLLNFCFGQDMGTEILDSHHLTKNKIRAQGLGPDSGSPNFVSNLQRFSVVATKAWW